jgi:hypothetical protein
VRGSQRQLNLENDAVGAVGVMQQQLNYANACVRSPGLVKRQVALLATPIADYFSHLNDRYSAIGVASSATWRFTSPGERTQALA